MHDVRARQLRIHRTLVLVCGTAYLVWWFFVHLTLPNAFNPIGGRLAAVACFFAVLGASYRFESVARRLDAWFAACCCVATLHYFYLFDRNDGDLNWVVGSYITVTAVCGLMQTARSLFVYSLFVAALSFGMLFRQSSTTYVVFLPGMLTALVFANVGLRGRLRVNDQLQESVERVASLNAEMATFSYSIAHDLRGPLRGINGFSRVLLEDYGSKLDDEGKGYLDRIATSADKMGLLIDALLGLARITRTVPKRENVDLSAQAGAIASDLKAAFPDRDVAMEIETGMVATGDALLLRALLDNLLRNAWKFTGRTPSARVTFTSAEERGVRVYRVKDNGAGFDMALAEKLFGPFQRLHSNDDFPGTGIGLATVKRIVERHGGSVWAEGEPDKGATFSFTLEPFAR